MARDQYMIQIVRIWIKMSLASHFSQINFRELRLKIQNSFQPDLRDLTIYCQALKLELFPSTRPLDDTPQHAASTLAAFTDDVLTQAIAQINSFKEIDAPLTRQKDTSLRAMSGILNTLARKAEERSRASGQYVHLTHVFYTDFGPDKVVAKNTFYGYRSAILRYALNRASDLAPFFATTVDKNTGAESFERFFAPAPTRQSASKATPFNVDKATPHRLTTALVDTSLYEVTETDPKLAVYPWFASRRHRTKSGISPTLTKLETVELAECVRFVCHYAPDLKFERRGVAGRKKSREYLPGEAITNGLLLGAPKPSFLLQTTSKHAFDQADPLAKSEIAKKNKRLASTNFNASHFWLDVEGRVKDDDLLATVATQLITGCRPSELVDGVIVSVGSSDDPESLGTLSFTIFGAKIKNPEVFSKAARTKELAEYTSFLLDSALATNSKLRGQFYHTETLEVFAQFPERVWLFGHLMARQAEQQFEDVSVVQAFLLEKVCCYRKLTRTIAKQPEVLELSPEEKRRLIAALHAQGNGTTISEEKIGAAIRQRNDELYQARHAQGTDAKSYSENFDIFVLRELNRLRDVRELGLSSINSIYQTAKLIRFSFLPKKHSFPMMSSLDGIAYTSTNVDKVGSSLRCRDPRRYLRNEFTEQDLNLMAIPDEQRLLLDQYDFATLQRERAEYVHAAVVHLGKRYHSASVSSRLKPTPYTVRHKIMSDLKGLTNEDGSPALSREDIARKAGHASTASQTGYGKAAFAEKSTKNRGQKISKITSDQPVKNPKSTAGLRKIPTQRPDVRPPEQRYEPRE